MATNREQQVGHMTGFPPAVYPFAFNSMRSHSPFDLLANSSLFGRFGADLPKEMAALSCLSTSPAFQPSITT
ncbi:retinoic acid receptor gamma isoform X1 [Lates japonicus]|uniref:Retinoic acid receptor gamma isoform X1 n=1 Tax=Lates japonicus TaxID=270547 RepID=A0AAD3NJY1_LATJO|nr:retinoic acid receptor gamma isoform X1 [Lates japonicus]